MKSYNIILSPSYKYYDKFNSSVEDSIGNSTEESDDSEEISIDKFDDNLYFPLKIFLTRKYLKILVKQGKDCLVKDRIDESTLRGTALEIVFNDYFIQ